MRDAVNLNRKCSAHRPEWRRKRVVGGGDNPRRSDTERKSSAPLRPSCSSSFQVRRRLFSVGAFLRARSENSEVKKKTSYVGKCPAAVPAGNVASVPGSERH